MPASQQLAGPSSAPTEPGSCRLPGPSAGQLRRGCARRPARIGHRLALSAGLGSGAKHEQQVSRPTRFWSGCSASAEDRPVSQLPMVGISAATSRSGVGAGSFSLTALLPGAGELSWPYGQVCQSVGTCTPWAARPGWSGNPELQWLFQAGSCPDCVLIGSAPCWCLVRGDMLVRAISGGALHCKGPRPGQPTSGGASIARQGLSEGSLRPPRQTHQKEKRVLLVLCPVSRCRPWPEAKICQPPAASNQEPLRRGRAAQINCRQNSSRTAARTPVRAWHGRGPGRPVPGAGSPEGRQHPGARGRVQEEVGRLQGGPRSQEPGRWLASRP